MVEPSPKILASGEKATTTVKHAILEYSDYSTREPFIDLNSRGGGWGVGVGVGGSIQRSRYRIAVTKQIKV